MPSPIPQAPPWPLQPLDPATFVHEGVILRNHRMITKPSTGHAIAAALRCCPEAMTVAAYEQAVEDCQKVLTPNQLVGLSKILSPA